MPPKKKKAAPQQQAAAAAPQQKEWPVEKLVGTRERHRHLRRMHDSERLFVYAGAIMYHTLRAHGAFMIMERGHVYDVRLTCLRRQGGGRGAANSIEQH